MGGLCTFLGHVGGSARIRIIYVRDGDLMPRQALRVVPSYLLPKDATEGGFMSHDYRAELRHELMTPTLAARTTVRFCG